ncbi:hypothetical protein KI387_029131, partial [Taxus chinensis]
MEVFFGYQSGAAEASWAHNPQVPGSEKSFRSEKVGGEDPRVYYSSTSEVAAEFSDSGQYGSFLGQKAFLSGE